MGNKNNLSILVLSCDKYSDLWSPFFECFFKYWPDREYPIYLGANERSFDDKRVKTILIGRDKDWSSGFKKIIKQIDSEYIFVILEDLFLTKDVDNLKFKECFDILTKNNFNHCHVDSHLKPESIIENGIGVYSRGMPYRVNVLGLWRRDYLSKILIDGESPWDFEIMGSYRSSYDDGFYCLPDGIFKTINTIEKGGWLPDELKICQGMGLKINMGDRKILSGTYLFKSRLQIVIVKLIILIPWKTRVKLMNTLRRLFFSY
jgi:hypothetical protein